MNVLRSSPFSFLSPACLLHSFILLCCACCLGLASVSPPFRQALMKDLRSSPFIFLSLAFALQSFIRCWCASCFSDGSFLVAAALPSSLPFSCASASGDAASIRQHSPAISLFILDSLTI